MVQTTPPPPNRVDNNDGNENTDDRDEVQPAPWWKKHKILIVIAIILFGGLGATIGALMTSNTNGSGDNNNNDSNPSSNVVDGNNNDSPGTGIESMNTPSPSMTSSAIDNGNVNDSNTSVGTPTQSPFSKVPNLATPSPMTIAPVVPDMILETDSPTTPSPNIFRLPTQKPLLETPAPTTRPSPFGFPTTGPDLGLGTDSPDMELDLASGSDNFIVPVDIVPERSTDQLVTVFSQATNVCDAKKIQLDNVDCLFSPGPQAGANVTKGFKGLLEVDVVPNTKNFWQSSMCPVNVHWHLGTEHYSVGEYDENGSGPNGNVDVPYRRNLVEGEVQDGFRCHHYDANDEKFTKPYEWMHCIGMEVGETYEVHWPHSAFGACGTVNQYQTPFNDGMFCNVDLETLGTLFPQDIANAFGVQGQIFTIVNDDTYYYPDLIRGWIVDEEMGMGQDIAIYTGSTTGESRSNEICSSYSPITWQVDRKCHMISASSFDKLCYDMKMQRDDMSDDLYAHGSRELVNPEYVASNQQRRRLSDFHDDHDQPHDHAHRHVRGGHHHHHQWF